MPAETTPIAPWPLPALAASAAAMMVPNNSKGLVALLAAFIRAMWRWATWAVS